MTLGGGLVIVTVSYTDPNTNADIINNYEVQTGTIVTFRIPAYTTYNISFGKLMRYQKPSDISKISQVNNIVTFSKTYKYVSVGIYCCDVDKQLYEAEDWDSSKSPLGVAILSDDPPLSFIVAPRTPSYNYTWWNIPFTVVTDITTTTVSEEARIDYNGYNNTQQILSQASNSGATAQAAEYCNNYSRGGWSGWYLGGLGEYQFMVQNQDAINTCRDAMGLTSIFTGTGATDDIWTSTQYDEDYTWFCRFHKGNNWVRQTRKDDTGYVVPLLPYY